MKRKLPRIRPRPSKEVFLTTTFHSLKKKYKLKEEQQKMLTEVAPEVEVDYEKDLKEKSDDIMNKKILSDLYTHNFNGVFRDLRTSYQKLGKEPEKEQPKKKVEEEVTRQKAYEINSNEGYDIFNKTKYTNSGCMTEFFKK